MNDAYKTIKAQSKGVYKEKKSKFYSFAYPVDNEDEIKEILKNLRKEFYDARHHCYAYRLGADKKTFRANDDGEPSNSSGKPILGQIQSYDLTNIIIVVIRYFGGVLLGVGGLVNAYKTAASEALINAEIVNKTVNSQINIKFDYKDLNKIMKIIKSHQLNVISQEFEMVCKISLSIRLADVEYLIKQFDKVESLSFKIQE